MPNLTTGDYESFLATVYLSLNPETETKVTDSLIETVALAHLPDQNVGAAVAEIETGLLELGA